MAIGAITLTSTLALGAPAQAAPVKDFNGCSFEAKKPTFRERGPNGDKRYNYTFTITCRGGRKVLVQHEAYQKAPFLLFFKEDKLRGQRQRGWIAYEGNWDKWESKSHTYWWTLQDWDSDKETIFHRIRIKATSNGVTTDNWSDWSTSPELRVDN